MARLAPGKARVQYIANKDYIEELLNRGESIKAIHDILIEEKKITMSYWQLRKLCSGEVPLRATVKKSSHAKSTNEEIKDTLQNVSTVKHEKNENNSNEDTHKAPKIIKSNTSTFGQNRIDLDNAF